jgi:hypothetical protein
MKDVTLLCIHGDKDFRLTRFAANVCRHYYKFGDVKIVTSKDAPNVDPSYPGVTVLDEAFKDIREPVHYIAKELYPTVTTPFALNIQWDGFILNPDMWSTSFFAYDIVAPPWPWCGEAGAVGCGGFTLMSQRFMRARTAWELERRPNWHQLPNEDWYICHERRADFEQAGVKFAPLSLAKQFGIECYCGGREWPGNTFGFHDFRHVKLSTWRCPIEVPTAHKGRVV